MDVIQQQLSNFATDIRQQAQGELASIGGRKELSDRMAGQKIDEAALDAHLQGEDAGTNTGLTGAQIVAAQAAIDSIRAALEAKGVQDALYAVI